MVSKVYSIPESKFPHQTYTESDVTQLRKQREIREEQITQFIEAHPDFLALQIYGEEEPYCWPESLDDEIDFLCATLEEVMDCLCKSDKKVGGERTFHLFKPERNPPWGWVFIPISVYEAASLDSRRA
uniref:Uncharacterized protein n=1 Tax=viral metagenome TaxID=1070528 RepID=A0A6M3J7N2_9ZZZZ